MDEAPESSVPEIHPDLVTAGVRALEPAVEKAIGSIFGAPVREFSELLADHIRGRRLRRAIRTMTDAVEQLPHAGIDPKSVPWKFSIPLLDGASLEDEAEPDMGERWASLLANAAASDEDWPPPSYVQILAQLSPVEARLLDVFYDVAWVAREASQRDPAQKEITLPLVQVHIDNLTRLGLLSDVTPYQTRPMWSISALGRDFVRACRRLGSTSAADDPDAPAGGKVFLFEGRAITFTRRTATE